MDEVEAINEIKKFEQQGAELFMDGKVMEAFHTFGVALAMEKVALGHNHPRFLKSADVLSSLYNSLGSEELGLALMVWALHPAGEEPYPIYKLEITKNNPVTPIEYLSDVIQSELRQARR